jgi:hypothetical protein
MHEVHSFGSKIKSIVIPCRVLKKPVIRYPAGYNPVKQDCKIKNKMLKSILPLFVIDWIPAFAGMTASPIDWIPAFAGMTVTSVFKPLIHIIGFIPVYKMG